MTDIVTVKTDKRNGRQGKMYKIWFDRLPDKEFGPYNFGMCKEQLAFCCDIPMTEARHIVMEASTKGAARYEYEVPSD